MSNDKNKVRVKISPAEISATTEENNEEEDNGEEDDDDDDPTLKEERDRIFRNLRQMDPFDEMKARADSGGSLFGVLKKEFERTRREEIEMISADVEASVSVTSNANKSRKKKILSKNKNKTKNDVSSTAVKKNFLCPPDPNSYGSQQQQQQPQQRHHRSKSLVHRKNTDDRTIIRYLHDYNKTYQVNTTNSTLAEPNRGNLSDYRRHSEATMNDRLLRDAQILTALVNVVDPNMLHFNQLVITNVHAPPPTISVTVATASDATATTTFSTTQVPITTEQNNKISHLPRNRLQSIQPIPTLQIGPSQTVNVCRRRSFSIRQNEICYEGDDEVILVTNNDPKATADGQPSQATMIGPRAEIPLISTKNRQQSWQDASGSRRRKSSFKALFTSGAKDLLTGICSSQQSDHIHHSESGGADDLPSYKVVILGGPGVGKSGLLQQFITSDSITQQNSSFVLPNRISLINFFLLAFAVI
ncbi:hypothetical protein HELRODRAFT_159343 [Helobdella robusta]|uniref:Uncharacterized protein n=1 Tax=Helobdella robusta TaxID=6412 RepID=T1ENX1_HELRO|nr:hypothetical protein HELRODRAFT_159343 [Helobdella robusta]ESO12761.1 hypothetical protein HELRODRAFT_159343 [Helobdella robusta]